MGVVAPTQVATSDDEPSGQTMDKLLDQLNNNGKLPSAPPQQSAWSATQSVAQSDTQPTVPPTFTQPTSLEEMLDRLDPAGGKIKPQPPDGSGESASPSPDNVAQDVTMGE